MLEEIEKALDDHVRPYLQSHGGGIKVISFEDGVLTVRFLGGCASCMSANETLRNVVATELQGRFDAIKSIEIDEGVSEELLDFARKLIEESRLKRESEVK